MGSAAGALDLAGEVGAAQLSRVLDGRRPAGGDFLPSVRPRRRRAGWDLTFASPKSLSLLAASAPAAAGRVVAAHRAAVGEALSHFERVLVGGRRTVAAAFDHHANAAAEPHLHTHVILANLCQGPAGKWTHMQGGWWPARRSLGAMYQIGLRYHLAAAGLDLDWRLRGDGLAELAEVPRAAIRAASSRSRAARAGGGAPATRSATPRAPWQSAARDAGLGAEVAARLVGRAPPAGAGVRGQPDGEGPAGRGALTRSVTSRLAASRSTFRRSDVMVALAACSAAGLTAAAAEEWTDRFCAGAVPVEAPPGAAPRWTTARALAADSRLAALVAPDRCPPISSAPPAPGRRQDAGRARNMAVRAAAPVEPEIVDAVLSRHPGLAPEAAEAARRLLGGPRPVAVLTAPAGHTNLLAHAAVLDAARQAWQAAGRSVALAACTPDGPPRWEALTGVAAGVAGVRTDVLVVDQADRRSTPALLTLVGDALSAGTRVVMVEGGTMPRLTWRCSDGLSAAADALGRLDPGPLPLWQPSGDAEAAGLALCPSGGRAAAWLLARWSGAGRSGAGDAGRPLLVGLGPAETAALNRGARAFLLAQGALEGPSVRLGRLDLQAGDQVVALRRAGGVPAGAIGDVVEIDTRRSRALVGWPGGAGLIDRAGARLAGYGYAVTPRLAARTDRPLLVLGSPDVLGRDRSRVLAAAVAAPVPDPLRPAPTIVSLRREAPVASRAGRRPAPEVGLGL